MRNLYEYGFKKRVLTLHALDRACTEKTPWGSKVHRWLVAAGSLLVVESEAYERLGTRGELAEVNQA
jgi:hypothetical protein